MTSCCNPNEVPKQMVPWHQCPEMDATSLFPLQKKLIVEARELLPVISIIYVMNQLLSEDVGGMLCSTISLPYFSTHGLDFSI